MNQRISIATIDSPQFINLQPMDRNPLISECVVKVFYIGQNRNGSCITREVATNMAKTLRGCPIVGYYKEDKQDFGDHGDQLIIDGDGARFNCLTKPYGFVSMDAQPWFQFFEDRDEFGNTCVREYLVTNAYLWTGQFPESQRAIDNHNPQSMELDENSLKGHWATDNNSGLDFFIINDAVISKLCILGEDVEPCFEGSSFLPQNTSSSFANNSFVKDIMSMLEELKFALQNNEGGLSMDEQNNSVIEEQVQETSVENSLSEQDKISETETVENQNTVEEFANKKEDEEKKEDPQEDESGSEEKKTDEEEDDEKKNPKAKNELDSEPEIDVAQLQADFSELQKKFASLEEENRQLLAFKQEVEDKQKDELIASFYMLSDEDKKDVIANKINYSLEQIEEKLSVICVRKKVNFNLEDESNTSEDQDSEPTAPIIFNLNSHQADDLPAWLKAVEDVRNRNN